MTSRVTVRIPNREEIMEKARQVAQERARLQRGGGVVQTAVAGGGWSDERMTAAQAAAYLGVSRRQLYYYQSDRRIPCYRLSPRVVFYKKRDLDLFIERGFYPAV